MRTHLCALLAVLVLAPAVGAKDLPWLTDYEAALKLAKKKDRLIMADFTGSDWCGWCIRLKNEVFKEKEFQRWAYKNVVLLELDFPRSKKLDDRTREQNEKLREKFEVKGYPTIVFINADGKEVARTGYVRGGPDPWIEKAEKVITTGLAEAKKEAGTTTAGAEGQKAGSD